MDHTNTRGLADVDGQLGLLPESCLARIAEVATGYYILAHVDIARRVERHDGCGCRGMLDAWYWASLKVGNQNEVTVLAPEMRGRTSWDQGECLIKSSNIQMLELPYRRRLAEHRRDQRRNRHRTRLPQDSSRHSHNFWLSSPEPKTIATLTMAFYWLAASAWTTAYEANHLQIR